MLQELKARLKKAIEKRDAAFIPGRAPRAWRMAVVEVEDLAKQISEIEFANRCKANPIPDWQADQLDVDWDED